MQACCASEQFAEARTLSYQETNKMDTRLCMRLAFVAAAFSVPIAAPAMAADDCKDQVAAEGKPASLRDLGAYPNSLLAWRSAVKDKYGSEYNSWRYAKDRDVACDQKDGQWVCKRKAVPCKDALHRVLDSAAQAAKKDCQKESLQSYGAKKKAEKDAITEAISGWEIDVRKKHGKEWAKWDIAVETDTDCHKVPGGIQCVSVGTACKS